MAGIKETKELIIGANEVGVLAVSVLKDGVQLGQDFEAVYSKLVSDPDFKAKVQAAYVGVEQVPAEVSDLDFFETLDIVKTQMAYIPKYVEAAKKTA